MGAVVYGTSRRATLAEDGSVFRVDLADPMDASIDLPKVDVAVFCAAMARFEDCRSQPAAAKRVNVTSPVLLAERVAAEGGRVILLSTSAVFDSQTPRTLPSAKACPTTEYGRLKASAEHAFLSIGSSATVFRLTKIVGKDTQLFAGWQKKLRAGGSVVAFDDHFFSPLSLDHVVDALAYTATSRESGIIQISGARDISYADAAFHFAEQLGVPSKLVKPVSGTEGGIPPNELLTHTTLDCTRLTALTGFQPPDPYLILDSILN